MKGKVRPINPSLQLGMPFFRIDSNGANGSLSEHTDELRYMMAVPSEPLDGRGIEPGRQRSFGEDGEILAYVWQLFLEHFHCPLQGEEVNTKSEDVEEGRGR